MSNIDKKQLTKLIEKSQKELYVKRDAMDITKYEGPNVKEHIVGIEEYPIDVSRVSRAMKVENVNAAGSVRDTNIRKSQKNYVTVRQTKLIVVKHIMMKKCTNSSMGMN